MPKLTCLCGFSHNLTPIPDDGWILFRDRDYVTDERVPILKSDGRLYECPDCGRLAWLPRESDRVRFFLPDAP